MIAALLCDLDGTILDREKSLMLFIEDQYNRLRQSLEPIPRETYTRRFIELDNRGYVWKDTVYQNMIEQFQIRLTWKELLDDYITNFPRFAVPFVHAIDVLQSLHRKGMKLGLITNGRTKFQLSNVDALGIRNLFDVILVSEEEGIKKPDKEIFLRALARLNISPKEAVYIGDHPVNDIEASRRIGLKGIWKEDLFYRTVPENDGVIRNWSELPSLLSKIQ